LLVSVRLSVLVLSLGLYLAAIAAPFAPRGWYGFQAFLAGLLWFWAPWLTFSWWSNVAYWAALGFYGRREYAPAAGWGLSAAGLGAAFAVAEPRAVGAPAFQLWVGSMAALGLGALGLARREEAPDLGRPDEEAQRFARRLAEAGSWGGRRPAAPAGGPGVCVRPRARHAWEILDPAALAAYDRGHPGAGRGGGE
jgi:hypothetical protein